MFKPKDGIYNNLKALPVIQNNQSFYHLDIGSHEKSTVKF